MPETGTPTSPNLPRLILIPGLITLTVTLLRLVGELQNWSSRWFSATPFGGGTIVGITWVAPVFGVFFALKLSRAGHGPASVRHAIRNALLAVVVVFGANSAYFLLGLAEKSFLLLLVFFSTLMAVAAALQFPAWPALFKTLLAYGYAARIPVAIVMFFAMRGNWGTHYDWVNPLFPYTGFWARYFFLGFFPQLILWVGFTVFFGALFGAIAAALASR